MNRSTVSELWRFPVKSFQGERVEQLELLAHRIAGDRQYALMDVGSGLLVSAKRRAELLGAWARTVGDTVVITLPDNTEHEVSAPETAAVLSSWLDADVEVVEVGQQPDIGYDMTLDPSNDDADVYEIPTPPGTFLDLAAVHLLTTASLASMAESRPDLVWDVRRFRPNIVVDHIGPGFPEDDWVGQQVSIGAARIEGMMRTMRCAMPLRAQPADPAVGSPALERSVDTYRAMQAAHANDLGLYASISGVGTVRVGDPVAVLT